MLRPPTTYRPEIDGLRAIAVGAVVLHHAGAPLQGGYLGVDIFFVISGYLITRILMAEMADGRFSLMRFYERRARRILPALVVVCLVSVPLGWALALPDQLKLLGQSLVAVTGFASNILFWLKSGYFAPAAEEIPLLHTWSLAVEEQFYLLFPLALMVLWRGRWMIPVLAGAALLSFAAAGAFQSWDKDAVFYLLPFRAWELLAGVLLALYLAKPQNVLQGDGSPAQALSLGGLALILGSLALVDPWAPYSALWAGIPVMGTVLVIACARPGTIARWVLTRSPLIWIGLISYSLYLWHQPVFAFARMAQFLPPSPWQMAGLVVLCVTLAWATWALVEQPFRDRRRIGLRPLWGGAVSAGVLLAALGFAGHARDGFGPERFSPQVMAILETAQPSPLRAKCHHQPSTAPLPQDACVYFTDAVPTWAVFGDSHGVELAHAIGEKIAPQGESLIHLTASACPPALTFDPDQKGCAGWISRSVAWLEANPQVHTVVLAWRHNVYLFGDNAKTFPALPDAPFHIAVAGTNEAKRAAYWTSLETLIARLSSGNRRILFLEPVPEIGRPIQKYALHGHLVDGALPTITRADHLARNAYVQARLATLPVELLSVFSDCIPRCIGALDGQALHFDDDHMSLVQAARHVAGAVLTLSQAGSAH